MKRVKTKSRLPPQTPERGRASPAALPLPEAARILSAAAGRSIGEDAIRADIRAGAPTNQDGTINLVHYGAWLIRKSAEEDGAD